MKENFFSKAKSSLIELIKRRGEISVSVGADELDLAKTTVRQHLSSLESKGFLQTRHHRHGRGRPRKMYSLSEKSELFFENRSAEFMMGFLEDLISQGHSDLVKAYIDRECNRVRNEMDASGGEFDNNLDEAREFLSRRGFMPMLETGDAGEIRLTLRNCPYPEVVEVTTHICRVEEENIERMLGCQLERVSHMASGDRVCQYCVRED